MSAREKGAGPLLAGKVILITGAASGIGRAAAILAAREGARVFIADLDLAGARAAQVEIEAEGGAAEALRVDLSDASTISAMIAHVMAAAGRLDGAVNAAGIGVGAVGSAGQKIGEIAPEAWSRMLDINLTGVWRSMQEELRVMKAGGAIVNMASVAGLMAFPNAGAYVAAKHGVIGLTRAAAVDYGPSGIRINALCPGYTDTPLIAHVPPAARAALSARIPLRRLAEPEEIAIQALWMLSDRASYLNGAALAVDGGHTAC
ncbi:SDR family NAD(P)-dependent oxidoreductase [Martelella sp. FOR1707]